MADRVSADGDALDPVKQGPQPGRAVRPGTTRPSTARRSRAAFAAAVLAVPVLAGLAACTSSPSNPSTDTSSTSGTGKATVDPQTVLDPLAAQLRTKVDELAATLPVVERHLTGDDTAVCGIPPGDAEWPRQANYTLLLLFRDPDTRPIARRLGETLGGQGWRLRVDNDTDTDYRVTAQKDGNAISFDSSSTDRGVTISSDTACVAEDGTVDRSYIP